MIELSLVIIGLIAVSFLCSLLESVILSISRPYIQTLIDKNNQSGKLLWRFKNKIEEPITAILTLNTISHTVGAAVSGAMALSIFGSEWMALFSGLLTLLILVFSEIIPKTLGANYWKSLSPLSAYILKFMVIVLKPLIIPVNFLSSLLTKGNPGALVSKAEIYNFIRMGYRQGVLNSPEFNILENVFKLKTIPIKDIMTPKKVTFTLISDETIESANQKRNQIHFSRIPLYDPKSKKITGIVLRRDIFNKVVESQTKISLQSISSPPKFVYENGSTLKLLIDLIANKIHLAVVLNNDSDYSGIVTLEDAIETLLGKEIVDEFDIIDDMRKLVD